MAALGDIYLGSFPFTSGQFSKTRPVLVLMEFDSDCLICRVTSANYAGALEIALADWNKPACSNHPLLA